MKIKEFTTLVHYVLNHILPEFLHVDSLRVDRNNIYVVKLFGEEVKTEIHRWNEIYTVDKEIILSEKAVHAQAYNEALLIVDSIRRITD